MFSGLFPNDVAGLVLVDPAPEDFYPRMDKEFPEFAAEEEKFLSQLMNGKGPQGEREEMRLFDSTMMQAKKSDALHATPTTLLIASGKADGGDNRDPSDPVSRIWIEELEKWGKARPNLSYQLITNSGHHIARFQPDTVVSAIREHIRRYQEKALKASRLGYQKPEQLKDGLPTATLKDVGLNESIIMTMLDSITSGVYPNIHSVLIYRNNKLVLENYFPGRDQIRGKGVLGFVDHHRDSLHDLRSVTKSFVGAATMIALDQKKIGSLDQRIFEFFPQYSRLDTGGKKDITIRHLLTMSSGIEWNEDVPYNDPTNSETKMDRSNDPVEFYLSQPLIAKPGSIFNYSGGSTQVLAAIIEKTTGMRVDLFAEKYLLQPLGINNYSWVKRRDGIPITASGLRLRSRDFLKFGIMYLNEGKWLDKQVITRASVGQIIQSNVKTGIEAPEVKVGYGFQIWLPEYKTPGGTVSIIQANGNGGQIIFVDKQRNTVAVVTAGNYNNWGMRKNAQQLYMDFIYPAMAK